MRRARRDGGALLTRCSRCNVALEHFAPAHSEDVPAGVPRGAEPLTRCPACGRLYWEGSHVARMRRTLQQRIKR